ncbi:MAG: cytochrome c3 family protein [Pseudomonadota bacterium]
MFLARKSILILTTLLVLLYSPLGLGAEDEECLDCHGERDFVAERHGKEVSLYVNGKAFANSIHGKNGCVSCHEDADVEKFPHEERLAKVECAKCHDRVGELFEKSLHGDALRKRKYLAPNCTTCHGIHNILPSTDERSRTYVMNIPSLCGSCHKEGTPVSKLRTVAERHVLEDYSQSIHGDGLFKRGLIVTAVCTSCHSSHNILRHEDPASSINHNNIPKTCTKCHRQIEKVHLKVIRGELWEKSPHVIPVCIDCHQPHKVRRVFYKESFPDKLCMSCHSRKDLHKTVGGEKVSLYVDADEHSKSVHARSSCIKCHTNVSMSRNPVCLNSDRVDCSICHSEQVANYQVSQHGVYYANGNPIAPCCTYCHGTHAMQSKKDLNSPTFARNIPDLCGRCHREGQKAAVAYKGVEHQIIKNYKMSIHGKGLLESGLMVTATCTNCHTSHRELPISDPRSTVNPKNIATTCAQCHLGIFEQFKKSVHSPGTTETDKKLPVCNDCHLSHTIERVDLEDFRQGILSQCGKCHLEVAESYFDTFHGKVSKLGSAKTAKCYDCHGAHNILPLSNPDSTLSRKNVVNTCKSCHPNSNRKFVGYLTHATHHDKHKYPFLYYTFWFMTLLLVGTFGFFGIHTLFWLPRALYEKRTKNKKYPSNRSHEGPRYERFDSFSRILHVFVIISCLSLALTGMTIKFSGVGVFQFLSRIMGGWQVTGFIHRAGALFISICFVLHIGYLIHNKRRQKKSLKQMLTGETTLMPRKRDVIEFAQNFKWFLGVGPRPQFGRWTYWEKFDYFAVFWGMPVIGFSGLLLWFPAFFTNILGIPGWLINVATIIHSDEALLAAGFIFTVHFFNTHFRPEKFPVDSVIFTGSVPLEELKEDRPREYSIVIKDRTIRKKMVDPPPLWFERGASIFGLMALGIGIAIIVLIIYSMLFLYR